MSVKALREWLDVHRPEVVRQLEGLSPKQGVDILNRITGENYAYQSSQVDGTCAMFLRALKRQKEKSMANGLYYSNPYADDVDGQSQYYEARNQAMAQAMNANQQNFALGLQAAATQQQAIPKPPSEPNKVLLLLGEDE